ncbi:NAD(P)H dehydrogenase (quinone) [Pontibacter ummariensis]|uniref:NAD(P)H dehydrogenase (Quinone) n=1 Tax=Pontibacter ummariensis TaxID=1610492 RepID=A0A239LPJ2_9BACT|nr:NAD(P)H:quinone oxidoreductase type IV [Pontibacter ummariensis]PRY02941.1 NAD(P)H dehydrogenase (quinone) [Pontibacter ummariensis]SNT31564.1 NAD(P)H dehydrogenase (quinone) [Pontibacter ummariensis]
MKKEETTVLVLFHSKGGTTYKLATAIARGIEKQEGVRAVLKQVPHITLPDDLESKPFASVPYATPEELAQYDGIAFGSPIHFGSTTADMRLFLEGTLNLWSQHRLDGVPATVFMAAGGGAAREAAILSLWSTLSVHGMVLVPTGMRGAAGIDKSIAQGNTVFGTTALATMPGSERPSESELYLAELQGEALAKIAKALAPLHKTLTEPTPPAKTPEESINYVEQRLLELGLQLPVLPEPVGNYVPYTRSGNLVFINQVALKEGKVLHPGVIGQDLTIEQAKEATRQTMLNVLAVLKSATHGDLSRVKQVVQLTGFLNTPTGYTQHAGLMNVASDLTVAVFGEKGKHARAALGASSIPVNSPVEIQAVFEVE